MKQDAQPIVPGQNEADPAPRHSRRRKPFKGGLRKPELKMTSMIDVVFLLLIFFVATARFQIEEGALLANLPGDSTIIETTLPPPVPVRVELSSADDGMTYLLSVDGVEVAGAAELSAYMANRVQTGQMASDDLVKINPQGTVRWQHVLNVYNACVSAELEQVAFAAR
jgi:biopolymer transport protein ExbD